MASRPRGSTRNSDGWSVAPTEPHWRINGGFSPSLSARWEQKQARGSPVSSRRSSISSPFSHHQHRDVHVGSIVSPLESPPEGFRLPQWTPLSHDASVGDFIAAAAEPLSRASGLTSASEACLSTGVSDTLSSSSSHRLPKDTTVAASHRPCSHLYRSFSRHCLSKLGSRRLFGRQKSDALSRVGSVGRQNQALLFENVLDFHEPGSRSEGVGNKPPLTLSQLVASSTREAFHWSDMNSVSQLSWSVDEDGMNACMPLPFERIRADFFQPDEDNGGFDSDDVLEKCELCSRGLSYRSPWSSQGYAGNNDLPVVSVLACGHVFHADCLEKFVSEKTASEIFKANPSCPQCMQLEKAALKSLMLRLGRVKHTFEPLKKQFVRFFRGKSHSLALKADEDSTHSTRSLIVKRKGALLRSLSKLQAPLQAKAMKVSAFHNRISR